jgi:hypothetical protein
LRLGAVSEAWSPASALAACWRDSAGAPTHLVGLAPVHIGAPGYARGVEHMGGLHLC